MTKFIHSHQIYLTPISPIHIGCGEDFEPTNYVLNNNVLYHFDSENLRLSSQQKDKLFNAVKSLNLLAIQNFFADNLPQAIEAAHYFVNVAESIQTEWKNKIGKVSQYEKDNKVICSLAIERNSYLPLINQPYIPSSSVKGALTMAFLEKACKNDHCFPEVISKEEDQTLVKRYLGTFSENQLRQIKFGDFIPTNNVESKVYYALNFKKTLLKNGEKKKGITLRREAIIPGQYRALKSELTIWDKSPYEIKEIIETLNQFYFPIFEKEMTQFIEANFVNEKWLKGLFNLISTNQIALIRLGKNGADSKVYQGENIAQIEIIGEKGSHKDSRSRSTTFWFAGEYNKQEQDLLPFGWALLEFNPEKDNQNIKMWCDRQSKTNLDKQKILEERNAKQLERQKQQQEEALKQQALLKAEQEKLALINAMGENQRKIFDFVEKLKNTREYQFDNNGSPLLKEAENLLKEAVNFLAEEKAYCYEQITIELLKSKIQFKKKDTEKNINKLRNKLVNN